MTTLVVSGAQALGNTLVQTATQTALSFANSAVSNLFDNRVFEGPRLNRFHLTTSRDGTSLPRSYGRVRVAGHVIWASRIRETATTESAGGKGGPKQKNYSYSISFALALCEGEIQSVERFWVNGAVMKTAGLAYRIYHGTSEQLPDPVISAIDGVVPAFRGTAYVVFEDFPLDDYGGRLPQFNAEVTRVPPPNSDEPRLENLVTGVHLLPSSGEFAYATDIIEDISSSGAAKPVNMNNISGEADITLALDRLETALPECRNVSLVISWFGDDLRAGECKIRPGVETSTRLLDGGTWQVGSETREDVYLISADDDGRPVYGGTPSDASILQAIASLKSRGFNVTIYPFILMDIPEGNGLADPYGGGETGLRRFILHYAKLAQIAGGVDRFVISSEMVGLTTIRSSRTVYPAVQHLRGLLADVRILQPEAKLSYAADWSEYFGHHPQDGTGDINFHLDALWADANLDGVGIDAYFSLADWRGGEHVDAAVAESIYDPEYLSANLRSGEGFEFYYASEEDRGSQSRTVISDLAYGKDWVFRYKDLFNWWHHPHYNRLDGEETTMSPWVPRGKPFWLTEIGCPAIDKGANQPNVFYDPKSAESSVPYFSAGSRDDLMQRRYLEAFLGFYTGGSHNPSSDVYGGRMIDMDAAHVWCWDARPYPDFPARSDVWADGPNWELGHWLTGRTGLVLVADVVRDLVLKSGVLSVDVSEITGVLEGYTLERTMSTRAALGPLAMIYGFDMVERADSLSFKAQDGPADVNLTLSEIAVENEDAPALTRMKDDPEGRNQDVRLHYYDGARDHQPASLFARDSGAQTLRILDIEVPIVMDAGFARVSSDRLLERSQTLDQSVDFLLPASELSLEVGDRVSLPGQSGVWQISRMDREGSSGGFSRAEARAASDIADANPHVALTTPILPPPISWAPKPEIICLDIPNVDASERTGPLVGVRLSPFSQAEITAGGDTAIAAQPLIMGDVQTAFKTGPAGRIDYGNRFEFTLSGGEFSSITHTALLSGENRFVVETDMGWEVLQIGEMILVSPNRYRAGRLLRGQFGTDADMSAIDPGAKIIWLGQGLINLPVTQDIGEDITLSAIAAGREAEALTLPYHARHLRPLSPVHGRRDGNIISWIRRSREDGDSWSGLDVPLGEDISLFKVDAIKDGAVIETVETDITSAALQTFDADHFRISQGSTRYGYGPPLILER